MSKARQFIKVVGISLLSLLAISTPKDLITRHFVSQAVYADSSKREIKAYEGNLEDLYQKRALALLNSDSSSVAVLDGLIETIEPEAYSSYEIYSRREYLIQTATEFSRRFQEKNAKKEELKELFAYSNSKLRDYKEQIKLATHFTIYQSAVTERFCIDFNSNRILIQSEILNILNRYNEDMSRLVNSLNSKDNPTKRLIARTIYYTASDIKDLNSVSERENVPLNVLLGFATIESVGNPFAVGSAGEIGRFQIKPNVAEMFYRKYPERFGYYDPKTLRESLVRDPQLSATIAALILKDNNLNYPEKALAYNQGVEKIKGLELDTLRSHWYVQKFERAHKALEEKLYLF